MRCPRSRRAEKSWEAGPFRNPLSASAPLEDHLFELGVEPVRLRESRIVVGHVALNNFGQTSFLGLDQIAHNARQLVPQFIKRGCLRDKAGQAAGLDVS
jgi:hypothetical protein